MRKDINTKSHLKNRIYIKRLNFELGLLIFVLIFSHKILDLAFILKSKMLIANHFCNQLNA